MSQRFEGRNLEEALNNASAALGLERWQLTYHVLVEKRGFLGGMKRVVIEADANPSAAPPAAPAPVLEARATGVPPAPHERPRSRGRGERRDDRGRRESGRRERGGRQREGRGGGDRGRSRHVETFVGDLPEQEPRSEAAAAVVEWIERTLELAGLDVVTRSEETEQQIVVRLYGSDGERLVDRHGELLDALQVLANKSLVGRSTEKEIELDCEDFKERRVEDLERRAHLVADRVRQGGREELLPAMSPIERRIVHVALQDDEDVTTESRGEGFYKRVAVVRRPMSEEPAERPAGES